MVNLHLEVDTHCHTIASGHAYSTIIENAREAAKKGLKMIAITDHGPSMPGGPHRYYFGNLKVVPRQIEGVYILRGIEANILGTNGKLDISNSTLKKLDIVLAGFHAHCFSGKDVEENTAAAIAAMKNPHVDILVHPGNPQFPIDIDKVVAAAKEYNVCIEINNSSLTVSRRGSEENCLMIAKKAAEQDVKVAIGSDAHICFDVGNFDTALSIVKQANIKTDNILNTSMEEVIRFLESKGRKIVPDLKTKTEV